MFVNREEAGEKLGEKLLQDFSSNSFKNCLVLAVPRGGVIVAQRVAQKINCPLDIIVTRKIGAPGSSELAIGAVGETNGGRFLNQKLINDLGVSQDYLEKEIKRQQVEIKRREKLYRFGKKSLNLDNKWVVIVDDGAATGATLIAAAREVWNNKPKKVIIALPVTPPDTLDKLEKEADSVVVLQTPEPFFAVGQFYEEFEQTSDKEVIEILKKY